MFYSNMIVLAQSIVLLAYRIYSRCVCMVISAALYQGFVIVEIFVHSYTVVYPPYLSKYIVLLNEALVTVGSNVLRHVSAKTVMLNKFSRWLIKMAVALMGVFIAPITYLVNIRRNRKCPPPTNPLLFHSATKLADMIQRREVRSEDVVAAYVARCQEVGPYLNAVVEPRYELALREARAVDAALATRASSPAELARQYPLLGVPITIKESIALEGMSNDAGCVKPGRNPAKKDATTVRLARAAGAIPIAVTNTPQLCMHWETYNNVTGLTRNPFDQKRTVGGSSGGEAALLGAGASIMGIGSDIAGSLRLPSMYTGVYGHKPTPRIVSTEGHNPGCTDPEWDDYFALGPMVRYAEDLPLLLRVLSEPNHAQLSLDKEVDIKKIKLCYMEGDASNISDKIGTDVRGAMKRVRAHFKQAHNIHVELVSIKNSEHIWEVTTRILLAIEGIENIFTDPEDPSKWVSIWPEMLKKMFGLSDSILTCVLYGPMRKFTQCLPKRNFKEIKDMLETMKSDFSDILSGDCVMLYPTSPHTAHVHYQAFYKFLNLSYLAVFNVLGLPVTNCPLGLTASGLPVGIQLVADKYNDHLTIAVAKELETAFGGWVPPNAAQACNGFLKKNF